jgi:hypothetical protein
MNLTPAQINKVVTLQQDYHIYQQQVEHLQQLLTQLCQEQCDVEVNFSMHNRTVHEANNQVAESATMSELLLGKMDKLPACKNKLQFDVSASAGIRILNSVMAEKQELLALLHAKIEAILIPAMKIEITNDYSNPIQNLHT